LEQKEKGLNYRDLYKAHNDKLSTITEKTNSRLHTNSQDGATIKSNHHNYGYEDGHVHNNNHHNHSYNNNSNFKEYNDEEYNDENTISECKCDGEEHYRDSNLNYKLNNNYSQDIDDNREDPSYNNYDHSLKNNK
jgi:hypothetical protein